MIENSINYSVGEISLFTDKHTMHVKNNASLNQNASGLSDIE
jgi:hypothetical protein